MASLPDAGRSLRPDPGQMRAFLSAILEPGRPFEIRALKPRKAGADDPYAKALSGWFDDPKLATAEACRFAGAECAGVYVTFNELHGYVMSWGAGTIAKRDRSTTDADVKRLRHFMIDIDPVRPTGTNATDAEREAAQACAKAVYTYLFDLGWPRPVYTGSSGNGSVILCRVDLAPDDAGLIDRVVRGIAERFSDDRVTIDTAVANPARLIRLPGSVNAKAITPTPDRPWRMARGKVVTSER
jgi:hypothetical protein